MSFPKYPTYKNSGVVWLGDVPEHWVSAKFARVILAIKDGTHGTFERLGDGEPLLSAKNVANGFLDIADNESLISQADHDSIVSNGFPSRGDLLLTIVGTIGRACVYNLDKPMAFQRSVCFLRFTDRNSSRYFYYFSQSKFFQEQLVGRSKSSAQAGVYMGDVAATSVVFPSDLEEQIQIARFLDHETAKIDALIEEQERLIELLKEKRQAVISHAVTKGLDPSVPMKDSGVEWLGEVPAHWALAPLKYLAVLNPRKSGFSGDAGLLCSFVPMEKLKTGALLLDEDRPTEEVFGGYTYFENGDILQAKVTPCFENKNIALAKGLTNGVGFGSSEINVIRPGQDLDAQYLFYRMQEDAYMSICASSMIGAGGLKRVPTDVINNFVVAIPAVAEQLTIASYIDSCLADLDVLAATALETVRLLQERRSALISAAVTGKIDVRDWHPPKLLSHEPLPEDKSCLESI